MANVTMLGTDGKEYEVVKILDAETKRPLEGNPLGLIKTELLEAGPVNSSQLISFSDIPALIPTINQLMADPEWMKSFSLFGFTKGTI